MQASRDIGQLVAIMKALRDPTLGCPWDIEQSFETIAPYTIEEAYEVADAIERRDPEDLREELGDLLLQVVYHAEIANEKGLFGFEQVVEAITEKLIRRHPHVFGDEHARSARSAKGHWERIKAEERQAKAAARTARSTASAAAGWAAAVGPASQTTLLDGVPLSFPALTQALKVQQKAATVGFDWQEDGAIREKIAEETREFDEALASGDRDEAEDEFGDLLFSLVNLSRFHGIDPEKALRRTTRKFRDRFAHIERQLANQSRTLQEASLAEMETLWVEAKLETKAAVR